MAEKTIGTNIENKEIPSELRVRFDRDRRVADLMGELKMGGTVQFILTKNSDLWFSDMGHYGMMTKNGIQHDDVRTEGSAWVDKGILEVEYRSSVSDVERAVIRKELEALT